jgi:hypothetical protein
MWKSVCSLLMIAIACVPAEAAKFSCKFAGSANPCSVDTQTHGGGSCQQTYPEYNLTGVCEGGPMSDGSEFDCYFATGSQRPRKLGANELSSSSNLTKALAEQPGYRTVAIEYITGSAAGTLLRVAYTLDTGFAADVVCSPQ